MQSNEMAFRAQEATPRPKMGACLAFTSLDRRSEELGRLNVRPRVASGTQGCPCAQRPLEQLCEPRGAPSSRGSAAADGNCVYVAGAESQRGSPSARLESLRSLVGFMQLQRDDWRVKNDTGMVTCERGGAAHPWFCEGQVHPEQGKKALPSFQDKSTVACLMSSNH